MFNKKKKQIETLKNNNTFLTNVNSSLRKDNERYQLTNIELGNQCIVYEEIIAELKKEKKNLKRKVTILEKEKNNGTN